MARRSPKHILVMLLAVLLTVGFSLSAAQASVMSARMTLMTSNGMPGASGMAKMSDTATNGACKACLKGTGGNGNAIHCPLSCIALALAVLPQGLATTIVLPGQQLSAHATPFLHGRSSVPDPFPPRPSDIF